MSHRINWHSSPPMFVYLLVRRRQAVAPITNCTATHTVTHMSDWRYHLEIGANRSDLCVCIREIDRVSSGNQRCEWRQRLRAETSTHPAAAHATRSPVSQTCCEAAGKTAELFQCSHQKQHCINTSRCHGDGMFPQVPVKWWEMILTACSSSLNAMLKNVKCDVLKSNDTWLRVGVVSQHTSPPLPGQQ